MYIQHLVRLSSEDVRKKNRNDTKTIGNLNSKRGNIKLYALKQCCGAVLRLLSFYKIGNIHNIVS